MPSGMASRGPTFLGGIVSAAWLGEARSFALLGCLLALFGALSARFHRLERQAFHVRLVGAVGQFGADIRGEAGICCVVELFPIAAARVGGARGPVNGVRPTGQAGDRARSLRSEGDKDTATQTFQSAQRFTCAGRAEAWDQQLCKSCY